MRTVKLRLACVAAAAVALSLFTGCSAEARKARRLEKAATYFQEGKYDSARLEYLNVLQADQKNTVALERVGLIWLEHGANVSALPFLVKARELSPRNHDLRVKLGNAFLAAGKIELARREAKAVLESSSGHAEALYLLVQCIRTAAHYNDAQKILKEVTVRNEVAHHLAAAGLAQLAGDIAAAKTAALRAISNDPKSDRAHSVMAAIHFLGNDAAAGEKELKLAADVAPVRSLARLKYAEFKAQKGGVPEAIPLVEEVTKQAPDYVPAWIALAQLAILQKKYDEAIAHLQHVWKRDPSSYDAGLVAAQISMAKGEVDQAIDQLTKLGKAYDGLPGDKFQLARAYLMKKKPAEAANALKMTIAANPDHEEAVMQLGQISLAMGQAEAVVPMMVELLTRRPNLMRAQVILIDALRLLKRPDDAAKVIREQIRVYPKNAQPHFLLGVLMREQNHVAEARASFEKALELAPESLPPAAQLVELDLQEKKFPEALARARAIVAKHPKLADAHFLEAKVYAANSKWREAEAVLLNTIEQDPNHAATYELLSIGYLNNRLTHPPPEKLEALLAQHPTNARVVLLAASIFTRDNNHAKARELYEKFLTTNPDATVVLNNLAYLYAEQFGDLDRARDLGRRARKLEPESPIIADTLGWILFKRKEFPESLELLKESAAKIPNNAEIQYHLGMAYQAVNQPAEAKAAFEKAANAPGEFPGKDDLNKRLAALGGATTTAK